MVVCHCEALNDEAIRLLLVESSLTVDDIAASCGAGAQCGGCRDSIQAVLDAYRPDAARG
ncbi:MAG: (2Fe-2S)-binding protein [Acidimicrobiales bacterium]|nr:(2Fe-2S)-binding protein [Acidimicrobiales bacterium]